MEDNEIIALFNNRSQSAVEEASKKFGGLCKKIASDILNSKEDCEECVNDTYMKLWDSIPPANPNILSAYIAKITRNLALTKYRENHRQKRGSGNTELVLEELENFLVSDKTVEQQAERTELVSAINDFLSQQPKDKRIIFVQRYWYCCSTAEIAERNGISKTNVTTLLSRMRTALKKYLEERGL